MKVKEYRIFTFYFAEMGQNLEIYLDEDTQLMIKAAEGVNNARAELCDKYLPIITAYATKRNGHNRLSEDIAQEVFKRLLPKISDYRPTSSVKTYLFKFARNIIREHQRKPRHQFVTNDYLDEIIDKSENLVTTLRQNELAEIIEKAKNKLPNKQRQAVKLLYYSNTSIAGAAKLAGCSTKVLHQRFEDAKKRLAVLLKQFRDY